MSLERAQGRLSPARLLRHQTRDPARVASLLHWFKWTAIQDVALELLENTEASVRIAAAQSILLSLPITRAFELLP